MNNTLEGPDPQSSIDEISSLAYCMVLTMAFVVLLIIIMTATCLCSRANRRAVLIGRRVLSMDLGSVEEGINEETLNTYPKLLYSQMKVNNNDDSRFLSATFSSSCSICLGDYKESDMLRSLPDCGHFFHVKCVDPWLRLHSTCPICRKTPQHHPSSSIPVP